MTPFEYRRAADSGEAFSLLERGKDHSLWLAGGTDVLPLLKDHVIHPARLVDIKRLTDLNRGIHETQDGIVIGALTTLAEMARDPLLDRHAALLGQAARAAATPQLRDMATVAGNLLQRPRCWYFRNPGFRCWLEGGDQCPARDGRNDRHAIFGTADSGPCCAVHPSDLAPCLVALDAELLLRDCDGAERRLPVAELFTVPSAEHRRETVLEHELIAGIHLPALPDGARSAFHKAMARQAWSFALSAAAVRLDLQAGRIADARVVLGGVAGMPWRAHQAEAALRGAEPSAQVCEQAAALAVTDAEPLSRNAYKVPLTRGVVRRALEAASG